MNRPQVVDISVTVELPGGKLLTIIVPPDSMAIFFTDEAVEKMLATFYKDNKKHKLKRTDSVARFGEKITKKIFQETDQKLTGENKVDTSAEDIIITDSTVMTLWNEEDERGLQEPFLIKRPPCDLE